MTHSWLTHANTNRTHGQTYEPSESIDRVDFRNCWNCQKVDATRNAQHCSLEYHCFRAITKSVIDGFNETNDRQKPDFSGKIACFEWDNQALNFMKVQWNTHCLSLERKRYGNVGFSSVFINSCELWLIVLCFSKSFGPRNELLKPNDIVWKLFRSIYWWMRLFQYAKVCYILFNSACEYTVVLLI